MSVLKKAEWHDDRHPVDGDLNWVIDKNFDTDGVIYSGFIPKPEKTYKERAGKQQQKPLTELEQRIRERWHAHKDPVMSLKLRGYYGKFI